jgi:hypothetical protein
MRLGGVSLSQKLEGGAGQAAGAPELSVDPSRRQAGDSGVRLTVLRLLTGTLCVRHAPDKSPAGRGNPYMVTMRSCTPLTSTPITGRASRAP